MDRIRCFGDGNELYARYHDDEWGRAFVDSPDERELFERLSLEGFLAGLSWLTVLRKREEFRRAFAGFVPEAVAAFTDQDVGRLLGNAGIIRNRQKIEACVQNAKALLALHADGLLLRDLLAQHLPEPRATRASTFEDLPAQTPGSVALAKQLRRLGFRFLGPVTLYSMWAATGMIDDHLAGCWLVTEGVLPP